MALTLGIGEDGRCGQGGHEFVPDQPRTFMGRSQHLRIVDADRLVTMVPSRFRADDLAHMARPQAMCAGEFRGRRSLPGGVEEVLVAAIGWGCLAPGELALHPVGGVDAIELGLDVALDPRPGGGARFAVRIPEEGRLVDWIGHAVPLFPVDRSVLVMRPGR